MQSNSSNLCSFNITINKHGVEHSLNPIAARFIEYCSYTKGLVLDIGAAYGIASIPALKVGSAVIACDIEETHLDILKAKIIEQDQINNTSLCNKLTTITGKFPNIDLPNDSFDAVLLSHVLPFLSGQEIEEGLKKINNWLKPGGKVFILSYTIYNKLMAPYIDTYNQRKENGDLWPGYLENASLYWDKSNPLTAILPHKLNHLNTDILERVLAANGFEIEFIEFMNLGDQIPVDVQYDGKETIGCVACKSKFN